MLKLNREQKLDYSILSKPWTRKMSALQQDAKGKVRGDDDPEPAGSIAFGVSDQEGNYATRLISQWNGRETDTSSCLAFAPKHREGSNDQALKSDWQGNSDDAFIPLGAIWCTLRQ